MGYLKDTCVLKHNIDTGDKIYKVAQHCKECGKQFSVTDYVLDEIKPGKSVDVENAKHSTNLLSGLEGAVNSKVISKIEIDSNQVYKKNFRDIRRRYYYWISDTEYLKKLVDEGSMTLEEVRSKGLKYKDYGECSCIAVAMEDPKKYIIVSNDKGAVYKHPSINLFQKYTKSHDIQVMTYDEWLVQTKFLD